MRLHTLCSHELQHVKDWGHGNRVQFTGLNISQCKLHASFAASDKGFLVGSKSKIRRIYLQISILLRFLKFHKKPKEKDKRNFSLRKSLPEDLLEWQFTFL